MVEPIPSLQSFDPARPERWDEAYELTRYWLACYESIVRHPDNPLVRVEERAAWMTYHAECRDLPAHRYEEREPGAWRRLKRRLRELRAPR